MKSVSIVLKKIMVYYFVSIIKICFNIVKISRLLLMQSDFCLLVYLIDIYGKLFSYNSFSKKNFLNPKHISLIP